MIIAVMVSEEMAKYIDADKIIDYANEEVTGVFCYPQGQRKLDEDAHRDRWAFVREVMIVAPAVDVAPRWIPVTERLPEFGDRTLVTIPTISGLYVSLGTYAYEREWHVKDYGFCRKVIAWMPLPAPYKGGGQNE